MQLKQIIIDNFACFKHFEIEFKPGVNVIIGRNGAGKSSLIKSLVYVMNFIFTNDKSMGKDYLSAGNPDLKMNSVGAAEFYRYKEKAEAVPDCNLHGELLFGGKVLSWDMYKKSTYGASLYPSKYQEAYRELMSLAHASGKLPLLAYFSDSFPHKQTNISSFAKNEISKGEGILRNFGYYQWDNDTACTMIWQLRLLDAMARSLSLDSKDSAPSQEVNYIIRLLMQFSTPLKDGSDDSFQIDNVFFSFKGGKTPELWLRLHSGIELPFNSLPAGYLRLYGMVLDLAYRSFLLNRKNLDDVMGLVLIDEIDLHLHPSLVIEVIDRLCSVFPKFQFVVTTHSPLVVTNIKVDERNQVFRLVSGEEKPHLLPDLYGIDYNAGLLDGMGVMPTNEDIDYVKRGIIRAFRNHDNDLAEIKIKELKSIVSENRYKEIWKEIENTLK